MQKRQPRTINILIASLAVALLLVPAGSAFASDVVFSEDFESFNTSNWNDWFSIGALCSPYTGNNPGSDCEGISSVESNSGNRSLRYTVEKGENDGGWPTLEFPTQSRNEWTHVRYYQKFQNGFVMGPQVKGFYLNGSGKMIAKFQIRDVADMPDYTTDGHWHYGLHTYNGGEKFMSAFNKGSDVYPEEITGEWHCFEFAVHPASRSFKLWIDGDLKMDYSNLSYIEVGDPSSMMISLYWGWVGDYPPKTQSMWLDDIVISNSYIGTGSGPGGGGSSPPEDPPAAPKNLKVVQN